ncbi:enoyl-CoA hydratase/isomerase family protein [Xanthobacter dioxanivorans]|uniref:3-hydroxyisobutyryl-CoA hydrolase n=1 Tax=Xanthobacter dioxanivorans TaxID=2528964 RepID=A0A974PLH4_9HYPH|nr:enoyl-CoA hydratase/isomerase family protein [Xanthobacter dioxanivorans]QRG05389.1 enoyl-CoA hydratase/isomerase family protein [Xanthobacter dioxanivorans]
MSTEPEVLLEEKGEAGVITLNRPKALNALNLAMVREILPRLRSWAKDPAVTRVIIKAAGEKAFCAGGDVRSISELGRSGRVGEALAFFREEYVLNDYIGSFPKPYVALIDGICMGGGFGLSAHGAHRVAGDKYLFAMPEVNIGLFPDVGGTHVLPRLPGAFGVLLALTGTRIRAAEAYACGLATDVVPSAAFPALEEDLCAGGEVERIISDHRIDPGPSAFADRAEFIADAFGRSELADILFTLAAAAAAVDGPIAEFAAAMLAEIRTKSPTSLAIAMEQMRRGPALDLSECLKLEYRAVNRVAAGHDFYEGVRAVLVDRDNAPKWQPSRIEDVDPAVIAAHFDPIPDELELLAPGA